MFKAAVLKVPDRVQSYFQFAGWFILDALGPRKKMVLAVLATGFLGVLFQVKVFGLIIVYARHFSSGETFDLLGFTFDPRSSTHLLLAGSLLVTFLLSLSAFCIHFSRRSIIRLGRLYEEDCAKRVFHLLGKNLDVFSTAGEDQQGEAYLMRLARMDSRFAGRILRMVLFLFVPGLTLAVASAVLLYLEPLLTLGLGILSAGFVFYQYRTSKEAAGHSVRFERLGPVAAKEYKGLLAYFRQQPDHDPARDMVERKFSSGPVKKQLDAFEGRFSTVVDSQLITGLFMAVVLGLIILVMGGVIIQKGTGWGRLFVYVLALRYAMTNLQACFRTLTSINRFYPQVRRYAAFVQSLGADQDSNHISQLEQYPLVPAASQKNRILRNSLTSQVVTRGSLLSLITPHPLHRYSQAIITRTLLGHSKHALRSALSSMRFVSQNRSCPGLSLRQTLSLPGDASWEDLRDWFPDLSLWKQARKMLPNDLDKTLNPKIWDSIKPKIKFILELIAAHQTQSQWILMERKDLENLGPQNFKAALNQLSNHILVIVFNNRLELVGFAGEDMVAVADEEQLIGVGPLQWFRSILPQAEHVLGQGGHAAAFEEEEDYDDDATM